MSEKISLEGPVELIDGRLTLQISLAAGGDKLGPLARGIGEIDDTALACRKTANKCWQSCRRGQLQREVHYHSERKGCWLVSLATPQDQGRDCFEVMSDVGEIDNERD